MKLQHNIIFPVVHPDRPLCESLGTCAYIATMCFSWASPDPVARFASF